MTPATADAQASRCICQKRSTRNDAASIMQVPITPEYTISGNGTTVRRKGCGAVALRRPAHNIRYCPD